MLQVKNLFVKYVNSIEPSVQDVSFNVAIGDRIAILGPSGCGKTTILKTIAGLLSEDEVIIGGSLAWSGGEKKYKIRNVFQEATLLPWRTVEKNITIGLEIEKISKEKKDKMVKDMLELIGLAGYSDHYPYQLSIGMKQRVNFARALACNPDLILLDEPFSALDVEIKKNIQDEFLSILKERKITSILVTHNIQEALAMANRIIVLTKKPSNVLQIIENNNSNGLLEKEISSFMNEFELYD
jgi:NitT/TauT family transport system ATP-binding protein